MKIAIIGSDSFLAGYIIAELVNASAAIYLFGISEEKYPGLAFFQFQLPGSPLDISQLLDTDAIIYCAGAGIQANLNEDRNLIYELNAFQPIKLLNQLAQNKYKGKFISFGSYFEIGNETGQRFYTETEVALSNNPVPNHYASSKRILTRYLVSSPDLPEYFHFFLPNIYGKGENPNRIIPYIVNSIRQGTEIKLTSGSQVRQFIHTSDVAKTVLNVISNDYPEGIYNLCNNEPVQIKTLVKTIFKVMSCEKEFEKLNFGTNQRADTAMPFLLLDNEKSESTFLIKSFISLEDGIITYL